MSGFFVLKGNFTITVSSLSERVKRGVSLHFSNNEVIRFRAIIFHILEACITTNTLD